MSGKAGVNTCFVTYQAFLKFKHNYPIDEMRARHPEFQLPESQEVQTRRLCGRRRGRLLRVCKTAYAIAKDAHAELLKQIGTTHYWWQGMIWETLFRCYESGLPRRIRSWI